MNKRYPFLKFSIKGLKILAYIVAVLGIAGALIILLGKTSGSSKLASIGVLLMGGIYFLIFYLVSEIIDLLINLAEKINLIIPEASKKQKNIR